MEKNERRLKLQHTVSRQIDREHLDKIEILKSRPDYYVELEPFLDTVQDSLYPEKICKKAGQSLAGYFCIQAPFELFDALKFQPFKFFGGSYAAQHLSTAQLPVLTCPVIKSTIGILKSDNVKKELFKTIIIPTTCDWVIKCAELAEFDMKNVHFMELPHLKESEKSELRWLCECIELKKHLEKITGKRLKRKQLLDSVHKYQYAWKCFNELIELRRENLISATFFTVIVNVFPFENIEIWTENINKVIKKCKKYQKSIKHTGVFLTGSPVIFPNLKLLSIIEKTGMNVIADDLCSSERIFPGGTCYDDTSEHGLMKALANRYHKACICPTFIDNDRRINCILNTLVKYGIKGVIYHVLKGCHPYDIECITIEKKLKEYGYKFIKIETDYVEEDSQNILTRLEAFKNTL